MDEERRRRRLPIMGLLILLLSSSIAQVYASLSFTPGIIYHTILGGGDLVFTIPFTASTSYLDGNYRVFKDMNLFGTLGFYITTGFLCQVTIITPAKIEMSCLATVVGVTFGVYTPGKVPIAVTGATTWVLSPDIVTITPTNGVSSIAIIFSSSEPGGGYIPPETTPPTAPPVGPGGGGVPTWLPQPIQEVIIRLQPWWSKYGTAVIIGCVVAAFALYITKPGKKRRRGLDVVLNPDKFFRAVAQGKPPVGGGGEQRISE